MRMIGLACLFGMWLACVSPPADEPPAPEPAGCSQVNALVEQGSLEEAVPPLTALIVAGNQECFAQLIQYAQHNEDETLQLRLLLLTHRHLLERLPSYDSEQRARAERFLSGGTFVADPPPFSLAEEEQRLAEWQLELKRLQELQ